MEKDKKIKISVIGGSGFVGTHLCRKLLSKKINFEIIDKRPTSEFPNHYKYGDVRDIESLRSVISGDMVVNLAAAHKVLMNWIKQNITELMLAVQLLYQRFVKKKI